MLTGRISNLVQVAFRASCVGAPRGARAGLQFCQSPCPDWHGCGDPLWRGVDLEKIDVALLREVAKQIDMAAYLSPVEFERKVGLA